MGLVWRSRTSLLGQLIGLVRLVASFAAQLFYRPSDAVAEEYHKWYYGNLVWTKTTYMGINCWKSVSDMWNYQEILSELQHPSSSSSAPATAARRCILPTS